MGSESNNESRLAVSVEDTRNPNINSILTVKAVRECLSNTLALIIAGSWSDRIHMPPTKLGNVRSLGQLVPIQS